MPFFTYPYDDELLYSATARYHYYVGNKNFRNTLVEIAGSGSKIPTIYLPSNLDYLSSELFDGRKYSPKYFICYHTIVPVYLPFFSKERQSEIIWGMSSGQGKGLYGLSGIMAGSLSDIKRLYYCPLCVSEDDNRYGEAYFHRSHNVQGVKVCSRHGCYLNDYPITYKEASRIEFIRLDHTKVNYNMLYEEDPILKERLMVIAQSVFYLLNVELRTDQEAIYNKYHSILKSNGLLTFSGRVRQKELYEKFSKYYGPNFLQIINCEIESGVEWNWLKCITRKPNKTIHPLRHILFINFLCGSLDEFFRKKEEILYFGKGPWNCLNPAADHYKSPVVEDCKVTVDSKTRQPVGTFSCSCGFIFSRRGPDQGPKDQNRIGRIKNFGPVWLAKLRNLICYESLSLREMSRILRCDPKTIVKYSNRLGLREFIKGNCKAGNLAVGEPKCSEAFNYREQYASDILNYIKCHPAQSRTEIRRALKKQFAWLYRNDIKWLDKNLPLPVPRKNRNQKNNTRIDWKERDRDIYLKIELVYSELLFREKPVRITRSIIGKTLGISAILQKHIIKLPMTNELLVQITETLEEFQIRRIDLICRSFYREKKPPKVWQVFRQAGLRPNCSLRVRNRVLQNVDELEQLLQLKEEAVTLEVA